MAGLEGRERELTGNLSGGWRQRLALGVRHPARARDALSGRADGRRGPHLPPRAFGTCSIAWPEEGRTIFVTTHYMDEAEHCHRLAFIHGGRIWSRSGRRKRSRSTVMPGQVLEIDCTAPQAAMGILRAMDLFDEVSLYGALIHVVARRRPRHTERRSRAALREAGVEVRSIDVIAPSLEDVFIASVRG